MNLLGYDLVLTCRSCPEQYDVFLNGRPVGYMRLRWGNFTVTCPDVDGTEVYDRCTHGNGSFEDDERMEQLIAGVQAITKYHLSKMLEIKEDED